MRSLLSFVMAVAASLALFVAVFSFVHRPLTVGDIPRLMKLQSNYASSLPPPRVFILAGSNGRYSHRCAVVAAGTGRPCANLSVAFGIGLDFVLEQAEPLFRAGDTIYMPLEFSQYRVSESVMRAGAQNPVLVHDFRDRLWQMPAERIARAYGHFDLPFLFHGLVEMTLNARGFQRRVSTATVSPEGDEFGHTERDAIAYRSLIAAARFDTTAVPAESYAIDVLRGFLIRQKAQGVKVLGGWPTTPDDSPMDAASLARVRGIFHDAGQSFVEWPGESRYPRSCFLDSLYHLHETCQLEHSRRLALHLSRVLQPLASDAASTGVGGR